MLPGPCVRMHNSLLMQKIVHIKQHSKLIIAVDMAHPSRASTAATVIIYRTKGRGTPAQLMVILWEKQICRADKSLICLL